MSEARERHLEVVRTARYWLLGAEPHAADEVWCVLHGYRQSAERFLKRFRHLAQGRRTIVAPEALNRFYVGREEGRHGPRSLVGGTWMTREDRENEIRDYVRYLDALPEVADRGSARLTVLGFSQGVATAARWVTLGQVRPERLILWGDYLPPDLDLARARDVFAGMDVVHVRGSEDTALDTGKLRAEDERLAQAGLSIRTVEYVGGHEIDPATLDTLVTA